MENNKYSYCNIAELTHVGMKRKANEDWLGSFECQNGLVAVVCDGMGGHVGGAVASHTAVEAIEFFLKNNYVEDPRVAIGQAIEYANQAILSRVAQQPELTGMGATCVMVIVRDGLVYVGSVGDSRVYYISGHIIRQLTKDQSFVQLLVDRGELTPEQAERHPRKNEILNALGLPNMTPAVVLPDAIRPTAGDCLLLCSDGLSGMVDDKHICKIVSDRSVLNQQQRVEKLIATANANGGLDNVTAQLVEFSVTPGAEKKSMALPPLKNILMGAAALLALVVVLGVGYWFMSGDEENKEEVAAVEQVANEQDIKTYVYDPIEFEAGGVVAELRAGTDEGTTDFTLIQNKGRNESTRTFDVAFNVDSVVIVSKLVLKQEDSDAIVLWFAKKIEHLDTITCTLKGGDLTQVIKIPVCAPEQKTVVTPANKRKGGNSGTVKGASTPAPKPSTSTTNNPADNSQPIKAPATPVEPKDSTDLLPRYTFNSKFVADSIVFVVKIEGNANAASLNGNTLILPGRYSFPDDFTDYRATLVEKTDDSLVFKFQKDRPETSYLDINLTLKNRGKGKKSVSTTIRVNIQD